MVYKWQSKCKHKSNTSLSDKRGMHPVMLAHVISFQSSSVYYIYGLHHPPSKIIAIEGTPWWCLFCEIAKVLCSSPADFMVSSDNIDHHSAVFFSAAIKDSLVITGTPVNVSTLVSVVWPPQLIICPHTGAWYIPKSYLHWILKPLMMLEMKICCIQCY